MTLAIIWFDNVKQHANFQPSECYVGNQAGKARYYQYNLYCLFSFCRTATMSLDLAGQHRAQTPRTYGDGYRAGSSFTCEALGCSFQDRQRVKGRQPFSAQTRRSMCLLSSLQSTHVHRKFPATCMTARVPVRGNAHKI